MKFFYGIFTLFCIVSLAFSSEETMRLSQQIQELEDQKPLLFKTIQTCKEEIPPVSKSKKEISEYRKKVDQAIDQNIVNTVLSGGINAGFEILGASSGGKLVELGAWIAGKAIGVSMEKSSTFGGVAYYKKKIDVLSESYKTITPEVEKLHKISKSSDELIQSYYNAHGKYSDTFEISDTGVFQTRMRLVVEQADVALQKLEELHLSLSRTLDEAERDLKNLQREIDKLRTELQILYDKEKEGEKEQPKKEIPTLSDEDKQKIQLPNIKANVQLPNIPRGCYERYHSQETAAAVKALLESTKNEALATHEAYWKLYEQKGKAIYDYVQSIDEQRKKSLEAYEKGKFYQYNLDGDAHEQVKQGRFPTGQPFSVFLHDTSMFAEDFINRTKTFNKDLKELSSTILENMPRQFDEELVRTSENRSSLNGFYNTIQQECYGSISRNIEYPRYELASTQFASPGEVLTIKDSLLKAIGETDEFLDTFPKWNEERLSILRRYFDTKRKEYADMISTYESAFESQKKFYNDVASNINLLQTLYKSSDFEFVQGTYMYKFDIEAQESACETIKKIQERIYSPSVSKILRLEKEIKSQIALHSYHGTPFPPIDAYVEFEKDVKAYQDAYDKQHLFYSQAIFEFNNNRSNLSSLMENINEGKYYQLGLFYPNSVFSKLSNTQMKKRSEIQSLIKNFKIEINNVINADKMQASEPEHFKEYYAHIAKEFKENLSCLTLAHPWTSDLVEQIAELPELISKLSSKPTYLNSQTLVSRATKLLNSVKNYAIDLDKPETFKKELKLLEDEYNLLYTEVNETYEKALLITDKENLNKILLEAEPYFFPLKEHLNSLTGDSNRQYVEELYQRFSTAYTNKDLSSLMSLISDEWISSSDGTTLMDLEDTLGNSFSIFNEIKCDISSISVETISKDTFRVNYVIAIEGQIYENDIKHFEKSSVTEEVKVEDGRAKIYKTLGGRFWTQR